MNRRQFIRSSIGGVLTPMLALSGLRAEQRNDASRSNLKPVLSGEDWRIAAAPDLTHFGWKHEGQLGSGANEPNDHTIYSDTDGVWHLWACVRNTAIGRVLVHWQSPDLCAGDWRLSGDYIRAEKGAGESLVDWKGQEFIQSPFVLRYQGTYAMFYGGYDTGLDADGQSTTDYGRAEKQLCLMVSRDGKGWKRHRDGQGYSRLFVGPGAVRDPVVVWLGNCWGCYYCGHENGQAENAGIYLRTSSNLENWSNWKRVHKMLDTSDSPGGKLKPESPFVVKKNGLYYLFRSHGPEDGTYVFCSADPYDFGKDGKHDDLLVSFLPGITAPEIVEDSSGNQYISNIRKPDRPRQYEIRLQKLVWVS